MKLGKFLQFQVWCALVLLILCAPLAANDAIQASINVPGGCLTPDAIVFNGTPYSSGTYAIGTIQILYVVAANQFTAGQFGCFDLNMEDVQVNTKNLPAYPVTLNLRQTGSKNLDLTPTLSSFTVSDLGPVPGAPVRIDISIPSFVPETPSLNLDGAELVANLQMETDPPGSKLGTVTTIQVKVKLVHPSATCLKSYHVVLNNETLAQLSSLEVNIGNNGSKKDTVVSSAPGVILDAVLVANTCAAAQSFDLRLTPDSLFDLNPRGPNGNAVFVYTKSGAQNLSGFLPDLAGDGTPQGLNLCLANLSLPGNTTLLATDKLKIIQGTPLGSLPVTGFAFSAALSEAGHACAGLLLDASLAEPNPALVNLPHILK